MSNYEHYDWHVHCPYYQMKMFDSVLNTIRKDKKLNEKGTKNGKQKKSTGKRSENDRTG
jgi:hypothetical protein